MKQLPPVATFEGSPVAKATEILRACSIAEVAAVLANLSRTATGESYERLRRAATHLLRLPRGRPVAYDDTDKHAQMAHLLETGHARTVHHAAALVAATVEQQQSAEATLQRIERSYRRKASGQNTDLNLMRDRSEAPKRGSTGEPTGVKSSGHGGRGPHGNIRTQLREIK